MGVSQMRLFYVLAIWVSCLLSPLESQKANGQEIFCFHTNQASERGSEVALFDYAHYAEKLLGYKSHMLFPNVSAIYNGRSFHKISTRFPMTLYKPSEGHITGGPILFETAQQIKCNFLYIIKDGTEYGNPSYPDSFKESVVPTCVHSVFTWKPHGSTYAAISPAVTDRHPDRPVVPHMVPPPDTSRTYPGFRDQLGIPSSATVFCRHGAENSFNVVFVPNMINRLIRMFNSSRLHFVFLGTSILPFKNEIGGPYPDRTNITYNGHILSALSLHPQLHFLSPSVDEQVKENFFATCDAMLHARIHGESFGIAVGEFSVRNKPVVTYHGHGYHWEHIRILGDKGFPFRGPAEAVKIIQNFVTNGIPKDVDYNGHRDYAPDKVMAIFKTVFIDPIVANRTTAT